MKHLAVVLAAGQGTRMRCELPKVLHTLAGRPMIDWVLAAVTSTDPAETLVVVGHQADRVAEELPPGVRPVVQEDQRGTGHAVQIALESVAPLDDDTPVLVAYGDVPLVPVSVYDALVEAVTGEAAMAFVTVEVENPDGFGRVLRDPAGRVTGVVEDGDCTPEQRTVREVNGGLCAFKAGHLRRGLTRLQPTNSKGELYLTDLVGMLAREGNRIETVAAAEEDLVGVNSHDQLAQAESVIRGRINLEWMRKGVRMVDPSRTYIDHDVTLAPGVVVYPGTFLTDGTSVGAGAVLGPDVFCAASRIGARARVWYSVLRQAEIGPDVEVGPFASLRPGTVLRAGAKAGTFVEMKNTVVGEDAKVPHLSYLGDATVGPRANIGAGTITCNYDGYVKHRTEIGADAFIGSDTMLVAPVKVGERAVTGAGSVITRDVEPGALAVERNEQRNVPGFRDRRDARYRSDAIGK